MSSLRASRLQSCDISHIASIGEAPSTIQKRRAIQIQPMCAEYLKTRESE